MRQAVDSFLDRLPDTRRPRLWLALLCLCLWLPGFFSIPPGDRDESRFAQATRQMLDTGDYVRIRLGDEERNKKPVGIHWAQAAIVHTLEAAHLGSRTDIWTYRGASLLGSLLAVLATFHWGRALVGRRQAFVGAALLASCLVLVVETHIAKTDAALLATVAAAMGLMGRAYLAPEGFTAKQAAGFWLALGASALLKGPIGPMVPLLAGLTLAVADRAWRTGAPWLRALRPAWGIPLMIACVLPWFVAIGIATDGRFFAQAVGDDMLGKVSSGGEQHWGPPGLYTLIFGLTAFPAAFFVLRALPAAWGARLQPGVRFLLAWSVPVWLLFEAVATKLPHYTLPVFPALALLAARWVLDPLAPQPRRWLRWLAMAALWGVAVVLPMAVAGLVYALEQRVDPFALLALAAGIALALAVTQYARGGHWGRAALAAPILAIPFFAAILGGALPRLNAVWIAPRVVTTLAEVAPDLPVPVPPDRFGIVGFHEPSLLFATGANTRLLLGGGAAAADFLAGAPGRIVAVGNRDEAQFRAEAAAKGITPRELGLITGINYSRGRWLTLQLFRLD
ncbi:MAG TPA: glycosyltransferase family 39 protein [Roseomonas sp.]|jgi:hypothetical protein